MLLDVEGKSNLCERYLNHWYSYALLTVQELIVDMFANETHIVGVTVCGRFVSVDYSDAPSSPYVGTDVLTRDEEDGLIGTFGKRKWS